MEKKIIRIGQASSDGSQAGVVISRGGCSFTICACTHGYAIGYVLRKYEKNNSDVRFGSRRRKGQGSVRGGGIASAVTATEYKDPMKVIKRYEKSDSAGRYRTDGERKQR